MEIQGIPLIVIPYRYGVLTLYPSELYVMAKKINGLEKGLYHYNIIENSLELINTDNVNRKLREVCSYDSFMDNSCFAIFITSVFARSTFKYGERGYRFALFQLQNSSSYQLNLATCRH